jgi:hypothetical protein
MPLLKMDEMGDVREYGFEEAGVNLSKAFGLQKRSAVADAVAEANAEKKLIQAVDENGQPSRVYKKAMKNVMSRCEGSMDAGCEEDDFDEDEIEEMVSDDTAETMLTETEPEITKTLNAEVFELAAAAPKAPVMEFKHPLSDMIDFVKAYR